jgi:hypothetical protein
MKPCGFGENTFLAGEQQVQGPWERSAFGELKEVLVWLEHNE